MRGIPITRTRAITLIRRSVVRSFGTRNLGATFNWGFICFHFPSLWIGIRPDGREEGLDGVPVHDGWSGSRAREPIRRAVEKRYISRCPESPPRLYLPERERAGPRALRSGREEGPTRVRGRERGPRRVDEGLAAPDPVRPCSSAAENHVNVKPARILRPVVQQFHPRSGTWPGPFGLYRTPRLGPPPDR